jgi:hypothetical protein
VLLDVCCGWWVVKLSRRGRLFFILGVRIVNVVDTFFVSNDGDTGGWSRASAYVGSEGAGYILCDQSI